MAAPATPTQGLHSGQSHALATIDNAFRTFQASVSKDHAHDFHSTTLKDVWSAARQVENKLAAKQSSRNLRRIQPFLEGLDHYSKAIEVLCNGTPYLPWVWAPIKLCLIISSDFISAFEKLIKAYGQIAEALPRFDRLSHALKAKPEFQAVLALVYCDIVEFHHRAYKMFTDSAWKRFFDTSWKRFDLHFTAVLDSLRHHTDLVDREANAYGIASTLEAIVMIEETRSKIHDEATAAANARRDTEFEAVMAWFDVQDYLHEDYFTALEAKSVDDTCKWFFQHRIVERWIDAAPLNPKDSKLWVFGKPGSGKSVLCVNLVKHLRAAGTYSTAYHLFSYQAGSRNNASAFLRSIACQLLRQRPDSAAFIYDNYIRKGQSPSIHALKGLLVDLIASMPRTRIAVDGIDECTELEQKKILKLALSLGEDAASPGRCKVAIFSRDVPIIEKSLARYPLVSLTEESSAVNRSIAAFVRLRITQIRAEQDDLAGSDREYLQLEQKITNKADGMFLWAHLVLCSLEDACSLRQLQTMVDELPPGLENAYSRITDRLRSRLPSEIAQRARAIFNWIAFAERPLLEGELLDAVALSLQPHVLNNSTKLARRVLDYGKPLIDVARNGTVQFVHFTVKEFLLDDRSGPFLSTRQAYKEISIACTAYVLQALDLVDPMIDDEVHLRGFRDVLYAFHAYSWHNWLVHLRLYASLCNEAGAEAIHNADLSKRIDAILQRHNALLVTYNKPCPQQTMDERQLQPVTALCNSKNFPYLLDAFDEDIINETVDNRLPEAYVGPVPVERTLFRYVNRRYDMFADTLHATDLSVEPTGDSVSSRPALYHCSIVNCARKSTGFTTAGDRNKHEREHTPRIRCSEPSCQFASAIGFRSAKDLRRHMNAHHSPSRNRLPIFRIHSEQPYDTVSHMPTAIGTCLAFGWPLPL